MIRLWIIFLISLVFFTPVKGQVCCSLVGAVDHGGGTSANQWNIQWPSRFDDHSSFKWLIGFNTIHTSDNVLNIRYRGVTSLHIQISHYMGENTLGYVQVEGSRLRLEESLSYQNSRSAVHQLGYRLGIRYLLPHNTGYTFGELSLPDKPQYSNKDFPFKTGTVPSIAVGWINHFSTPWADRFPSVFPDITYSFTYGHNLEIRDNIYLDQPFYGHISSTLFITKLFSVSPFTTIETQKLLAPLSPWESERQSRWLSVIRFGIDVTPIRSSWNRLHFRLSFPLLYRSSSGGFPDGTEPVPRLSLSFNTAGYIR